MFPQNIQVVILLKGVTQSKHLCLSDSKEGFPIVKLASVNTF